MSHPSLPVIQSNVSLQHLHTFAIPSVASQMVVIRDDDELHALIRARLIPAHHVVIGSGSNMLFADRYEGMVLHMATRGVRLVGEESDTVFVEAAAGELWDPFVQHCIRQGWHGLENLAAIPGTVRASAVQNIGAYGCEAADCIERVHAVETTTGRPLTIMRQQCHYGYRDSVFKHDLAQRCIITSVVFRLTKAFVPNLSYQALRDAAARCGLSSLTPRQLFDLVTDLRWSKLPRPEVLGNAGSFFKNPVVPSSHAEQLRRSYPAIPCHTAPQGVKIPAAWLIEQCGWRGRSLGHCAVYDKQALVLVNLGGCTIGDVQRLSDAIIADVRARFAITLQPEVIFNR
ncbi:MAG: UDP-N-acetylmuramate dehydrogenase [Bacteroidales bacterium]|nr:UDP-N-acetylmuramate dehydrogenase [Bacteroidales bacterium]